MPGALHGPEWSCTASMGGAFGEVAGEIEGPALARAVAQAYYESREKLGFPMLKQPEAAAKKARA